MTEDNERKKEPFIGSSDRPEVKLDLDMPITDLRVRDLAAILGQIGSKSPFEVGKTPIKDFFDKPFPEEVKDFLKEVKIEKVEKPEKPEKFEKMRSMRSQRNSKRTRSSRSARPRNISLRRSSRMEFSTRAVECHPVQIRASRA
jgi:hypothetical protein